VIPVDGNITDSESGLNCHQLLVTNGISSVVSFLDGHYGITFDKYLVITETQYKSLFRMMGDITVNLDEEVVYDTDNMFLEIPAEKDYVLTPDKTHKYMKYIYETKDGYERSEANAEIIVAAFNAFYNSKNCEKGADMFSAVINFFKTDISIVDYNDAQDEIAYLLPKNSNEKLKVFVSDNIKADSVEEVSS
jgi:anionic cell wall polymer biosynthesis LytR-Cps2A-Psr (LCP) family protein